MHIALFYIDAGKGHYTPAKALSDALIRLGHTTVLADAFVVCNAPLINWMSKKNWRLMLHFPRFEAFINPKHDTKRTAKLMRYAAVHSHGPRDFLSWYQQNKVDCIVVTHFAAANMIEPIVSYLKLPVPVFEYAADVVFVPIVGLSEKLDRLYICTQIGKELAIKEGQPEKSITICPFPLKTELMQAPKISKQEARKKLGLRDCFTVLLNLGGEGIGNSDFLEEVVRRGLPWQVITVGDLSAITKLHYKQFREKYPDFALHTPGFVSNINEYISACDVQAGKAGANSLMESLSLRRPFLISALLYAAWPTSIFFERHRVGWVENDIKKQVDLLQSYSTDKQAQHEMDAAFDKLPVTFDCDAFAQCIAEDAKSVLAEKYKIDIQ
jgi:processive 1,2-diacylglycerol beta-glucosyltransferase